MCISRSLYEMLMLLQGNEQEKEVFLLRHSKEVPAPIVQEVGWVPESVWTGAENFAPPGFDPRTVQPVTSRYTDYATRPTYKYIRIVKIYKYTFQTIRYKQQILNITAAYLYCPESFRQNKSLVKHACYVAYKD